MAKKRKKPQANPRPFGARPELPKSGPPRRVPNEFGLEPSEGFAAWLEEQEVGIALSTYHTGRLFCLGLDEHSRLAWTVRAFQRAMGLCAAGQDLWLSSAYQVWRFRNMVEPGRTVSGYDRLYCPRTCHITGTIDIHDMAVEADGRLVFANTLFGCVATVDADYSFRPVWRPWWISALQPEDRCHLNGLALRDGRLRYVTAVGMADALEGWRAHRSSGGVLVDVEANAVVATGLSMPHSPRWHDGALYLLNAGSGWLLRIDPATGEKTPVCFCPGFARGLSFTGPYAVVGISDQRVDRTFSDLELEGNLKSHNARPSCAVLVIDLRSGEIAHRMTFSGQITELYEVTVLPGARRANVIGFMSDEVERILSIPPS